MPFFVPAKNFVHLDCVSLQVHKPSNYIKNISKNKYCKRKRACLFTSCGSITVEATLVITLFMMAVIVIESFVMMLNTEMTMQINMNNVAKSTAKKAFYFQTANEIANYSESISNIKNILNEKISSWDESKEIKDMLNKSIDINYLRAGLLGNTGNDMFSSSHILEGKAGIYMGESSIENGIIDMVVAYQMRIPFTNQHFPIKQRTLIKDWTGCDITEPTTKVYITKNGEVYHRSKDCKHLMFNITKTTYGQIATLRNSNGGKYKKCSYCGKTNLSESSVIYITNDGNRYHTSLECQGITRNIITIDISQIDGRRPCSSCGQEK